MKEYRPLPIGVDDFESLIRYHYYFVDKTDFIKELLDQKGKVNLFTRPRRFGKTLALSMLRYFLEDARDREGKKIDYAGIFQGLSIMDAGKKYTDAMGRFPVISLTLKSAKQPDFETAYASLRDEIATEYRWHSYVLDEKVLMPEEIQKYRRIMSESADYVDYAKSLKFLSDCLNKYHQAGAIVLIDEYDVPLENAYFCGFYEKMTAFIRSLFESALKTNTSLETAVVTGCLRISRESIFTGLNNLAVHSVLSEHYAQYFGFTEYEVEKMLGEYGLEDKLEEVKKWYNGYLFGNVNVYNPWSVINYVYTATGSRNAFPKPYWSNTSSNSIVRKLVEQADEEAKAEIEALIQGGSVEKPVHEDITYEDIDKSQDNLWNFLFFTGYLKKISQFQSGRNIYLKLAVPNEEVAYIYENTIRDWFGQYLKQADLSVLYEAVLGGDCETFAGEVTNYLMECISYNDYQEAYYHGFLCGLLKGCKGYRVVSNRESGMGRYDIVLKYPSARGKAVILEIKTADHFDGLKEGCSRTLEQMKAMDYEADLRADGYRNILKYGVCFYKKECMVKMEQE